MRAIANEIVLRYNIHEELIEFVNRLDIDDRWLSQFDTEAQLIDQIKSWSDKAKALLQKATNKPD